MFAGACRVGRIGRLVGEIGYVAQEAAGNGRIEVGDTRNGSPAAGAKSAKFGGVKINRHRYSCGADAGSHVYSNGKGDGIPHGTRSGIVATDGGGNVLTTNDLEKNKREA